MKIAATLPCSLIVPTIIARHRKRAGRGAIAPVLAVYSIRRGLLAVWAQECQDLGLDGVTVLCGLRKSGRKPAGEGSFLQHEMQVRTDCSSAEHSPVGGVLPEATKYR